MSTSSEPEVGVGTEAAATTARKRSLHGIQSDSHDFTEAGLEGDAEAEAEADGYGELIIAEAPQSYGRLLLAHAAALGPPAFLLVALATITALAPCELPSDRPPGSAPGSGHGAGDQNTCKEVLGPGIAAAAALLGVVAWLASFALRPACWSLALLVVQALRLLRSTLSLSSHSPSSHGSYEDLSSPAEDDRPIATTLLSILLRTFALESLRLGSMAIGFALLLAELARGIPHVDPTTPATVWEWNAMLQNQDRGPHHHHWRLLPTDPRFGIAMWVAFGCKYSILKRKRGAARKPASKRGCMHSGLRLTFCTRFFTSQGQQQKPQ